MGSHRSEYGNTFAPLYNNVFTGDTNEVKAHDLVDTPWMGQRALLTSRLTDLDTAIAHLAQKLEPALRDLTLDPRESEFYGSATNDSPRESPMTVWLRGANAELEQMTEKLLSLCRNLDL